MSGCTVFAARERKEHKEYRDKILKGNTIFLCLSFVLSAFSCGKIIGVLATKEHKERIEFR